MFIENVLSWVVSVWINPICRETSLKLAIENSYAILFKMLYNKRDESNHEFYINYGTSIQLRADNNQDISVQFIL